MNLKPEIMEPEQSKFRQYINSAADHVANAYNSVTALWQRDQANGERVAANVEQRSSTDQITSQLELDFMNSEHYRPEESVFFQHEDPYMQIPYPANNMERHDAQMNFAEVQDLGWDEIYDHATIKELLDQGWDEVYEQAEVENMIFDDAKLEPDYEAMSYDLDRHAEADPHVDYAEAYADVAGDATLSWRLGDEDPRDILNDIRGEADREDFERDVD